MFLAAVFSFFQANHHFLDLTFPMYDLRNARLEDVYSAETGMIESEYWSLQFMAAGFKFNTFAALWAVLGTIGGAHFALVLWTVKCGSTRHGEGHTEDDAVVLCTSPSRERQSSSCVILGLP